PFSLPTIVEECSKRTCGLRTCGLGCEVPNHATTLEARREAGKLLLLGTAEGVGPVPTLLYAMASQQALERKTWPRNRTGWRISKSAPRICARKNRLWRKNTLGCL